MYIKVLHQPLEEKEPNAIKEEDWALLDGKTLGIMCSSLLRNVTLNIANEKTMHGLLEALTNIYENSSMVNKMHLMQ